MNVTQAKEAMKICRIAGLPLFIHGAPGIGKSNAVKQVAEELEIEYLVINGPLLQPVDLLGLPDRKDGKTIWLRPEILPENGDGIILIDELPDSTMLMQKAYYSLVLEHRIQSHIVPFSWSIFAAGNRPEDKAFAGTLPSPIVSRFVHIGVYSDAPDFTEETVSEVKIDSEDFLFFAVKNFNYLVSSYLKIRPQNMYSHQAVPRTWEYISKLVDSSTDHFSYVFKELIKGTVGSLIGNDFNNFVKLASKIPSIDAIIADPENYRIPEEKDIQYALVIALIKLLNNSNVESIIKYFKRFPKEYQYFAFSMSEREFPFILSNSLYLSWKNINNLI